MCHQLLLCDEDPIARRFLADNLAADGYAVVEADSRDQAQTALGELAPDVIVADVNGQTLALLDWLRCPGGSPAAAASDVPVLALSSHHDELHRVRLLERGADDVIKKPFGYPELRARICAVLRRTQPRQPARVTVAGPVRIDHRSRSVTVNGQPVALSAREHALLCHLADEPERVCNRQELLREVWGHHSVVATRTLDTHASRLRSKLRAHTDVPLVVCVWGVGYRLHVPASA